MIEFSHLICSIADMASSDDTQRSIATEEPSSQLVTTLPNESVELASISPTLTFINHAGKKFVFPFRECSSWEVC